MDELSRPLIAGRDRAAFEAFARATGDRLVRTAYLLCGDRGHAEDIVQTALVRTARRWRRARADPEAYARRVVVNLVKDHWRNRSRRPAETGLDDASGLPALPDRGAEAAEHADLLAAARCLPEGQRAVLVLRFFDDLSVEQTAATLGVTAGTVKSQTSRALSSLRAALERTLPLKENSHADRR